MAHHPEVHSEGWRTRYVKVVTVAFQRIPPVLVRGPPIGFQELGREQRLLLRPPICILCLPRPIDGCQGVGYGIWDWVDWKEPWLGLPFRGPSKLSRAS